VCLEAGFAENDFVNATKKYQEQGHNQGLFLKDQDQDLSVKDQDKDLSSKDQDQDFKFVLKVQDKDNNYGYSRVNVPLDTLELISETNPGLQLGLTA